MRYTNMTTIFDKIRKGDLDVENTRSFKPVSYYKRPELIKPYLHFMDKNRLTDSVDRFMQSDRIGQAVNRYFGRDKKIDMSQMQSDVKEIYSQYFPESVVADMFNMYLKDPQTLDYEERTDKNKFRYKVLDKTVDSVTRVVSQDSNFKSMLLTRNMVEYMTLAMAYAKQVQPEDFEKMKNEMQGGGDQDGDEEGDESDQNAQGNQSGSGKGSSKKDKSASDILDKLLNNKAMETMKDDLINQAKEQISNLDDMVTDEELDEAWAKGGSDVDYTDKDTVQKIQKEFARFKLNMANVKTFIAKLLDRSKNYFASKEIVQFDSIWDADSLDGLQDYELLHPELRKLFIDDIMVKTVKKEGKIDLYIDISGSMDESMRLNGSYVTKLDFAKSFALAMIDSKLINNVYAFDTTVHKRRPNIFSILLLQDGGGTNITTVVNHIEKEKNNAIVLTDAEDRCYTYSQYAYMIGVEGCRFGYFEPKVMKQYAEHRQAIMFDGTSIYDIDASGDVVAKNSSNKKKK